MFREIFLVLLLSHIIGDFYLQTEKLAKKKEKNFTYLCLHGLLYWISFLLISLPILSLELFLCGLGMGLIHLIIDFIKYLAVCSKNKKKNLSTSDKRSIYILDQAVHITCLVIGSYVLAIMNYDIKILDCCKDFFVVTGISAVKVVNIIVALLLIHKPANITISHLISAYKPKKDLSEQQPQDYKAGRFIGSVERIIMLILLYLGQYSAIGLVLTAKSIARYDEIAKNKISAEYYLLGTLISTGFVIVVSILIRL
ncbi:MAG TPA: DUF3307 domain-containing protein [Mobilitalea sp.]|nr:DUF3307 domain-containing protein [Mobilitalea sp.]